MGLLPFFILLTILENNQHISQIFNFNSINSDYFKQVWAGKEEKDEEKEEEKEEEDSAEQEICNKLFESETCEKVEQEDKPIETEKLTEEQIKEEAIINRYLEPAKSEKQSTIDNNSLNSETKISSSNGNGSSNISSTIFSKEVESKDSTNSNQQINSGFLSPPINQSSAINNPPVSTNTQNLNNLNQLQLIDLISSTISNANNIDKNKVIQSLIDLIKPTKAKGGNVIESLKKIAEIILKEPSGSTAIEIVNIAKTK